MLSGTRWLFLQGPQECDENTPESDAGRLLNAHL